MPAEQVEDIEALQREARALSVTAADRTETYRRTTWIRFVLVFFPVPFVVLLMRLQLESWHYYLAGAAYMGFSALLYVIDGRASAKCDAAVQAAERAQKAYEAARP